MKPSVNQHYFKIIFVYQSVFSSPHSYFYMKQYKNTIFLIGFRAITTNQYFLQSP